MYDKSLGQLLSMLFQDVLAEAIDELTHHVREHWAHDERGNKRYFVVILRKVFHNDTTSLVLVEFEQEVYEFALVSFLMQFFFIFLSIQTIIWSVAIDCALMHKRRNFVAELLVVESQDLFGEWVNCFHIWVRSWLLGVYLDVFSVPDASMGRVKKLWI